MNSNSRSPSKSIPIPNNSNSSIKSESFVDGHSGGGGSSGRPSPGHGGRGGYYKRQNQNYSYNHYRGGSGSGGGGNNRPAYYSNKNKPSSYEQNKEDIFITEKSDFSIELNKCTKLLEEGLCSINIYGLGPAIPKSINIAFELKNSHQKILDFSINTTSFNIIDDIPDLNLSLSPINLSEDISDRDRSQGNNTRTRNPSTNSQQHHKSKIISAVKIKVFKIDHD